MDKLDAVAQVVYLDGEFKIETAGTHVICAVTNKPIPLNVLRYWSVEKQEAYIDAHAALQAAQAEGK